MTSELGGNWQIFQENGYTVGLAIEREQKDGFSILDIEAVQSDGTRSKKDEAQGKVEGRQFHMRIGWDNSTAGVYNGTFGLDGSLTGITFDELHQDNVTSWRSSRQFKREA